MAKKKITKKRTPAPKSQYGCDEVERYLDKAIDGIKKELLPRIDLLDKRDREQFEGARQTIMDANSLMASRQQSVEKKVAETKDELDEIIEKQETIIGGIHAALSSLHTKLDKHISEETNEFKSISDKQEAMKDTITTVQDTLNTVSANGNKGLHASLKDLYAKNTEVHKELIEIKELMEPAINRHMWWESTKKVARTTWFFKMGGHKVGRYVLIFFVIVLFNTLFHTLVGVSLFDWTGLIDLIRSLFKVGV